MNTLSRWVQNGGIVAAWTFAWMVGAWVLFYVVEFALWHGLGVSISLPGMRLMDALYKPTDSLVLPWLLWLWIVGIGGVLGFAFGIWRIAKRK